MVSRIRDTESMSDAGLPQVTQPTLVEDDLAKDNPIAGAVDPLDLPFYGAGPVVAVKRFYRNYAKFSGRASLSEFWWVALVLALVYLVLVGLGFGLGAATGYTDWQGQLQLGTAGTPFFLVLGAIELGSVVPLVAVAVRRLHDAGYSGFRLFLYFVPFVGALALIVFLATPAKPTGARFDVFRGVYLASAPQRASQSAHPASAYHLQQQQAGMGAPPTPPAV